MIMLLSRDKPNDFILDELELRAMIFDSINTALSIAKDETKEILIDSNIYSDLFSMARIDVEDIIDTEISKHMKTMDVKL